MAKKKKDQEITVDFNLKGIEIASFFMKKFDQELLPGDGGVFNIHIACRVAPVDGIIYASVQVTLMEVKSKTELAGIEVIFEYHLKNFGEAVKPNAEGQFQIPLTLSTIINSISLSTTRGILYSEFKGTYLQNLVLPIVDPKGFRAGK